MSAFQLGADLRKLGCRLYDDARSGSLQLLRIVPEDKLVVIGLSPSSVPHLEQMDELFSRIREVSRVEPVERLTISPQCGFSNSVVGTAIIPTDQERKLTLVLETVRRVSSEDIALLSSS